MSHDGVRNGQAKRPYVGRPGGDPGTGRRLFVGIRQGVAEEVQARPPDRLAAGQHPDRKLPPAGPLDPPIQGPRGPVLVHAEIGEARRRRGGQRERQGAGDETPIP